MAHYYCNRGSHFWGDNQPSVFTTGKDCPDHDKAKAEPAAAPKDGGTVARETFEVLRADLATARAEVKRVCRRDSEKFQRIRSLLTKVELLELENSRLKERLRLVHEATEQD